MAEKKTFKAIQVQVDRSLKLEEKEIPKIDDNQILIKVEASSINLVDLVIVKGRHPMCPKAPHTAGLEGAGTAVEVGKNHASRIKAGDKVVLKVPYGAWAEYCVAPGDGVFPMHPDNNFEEAASHFINAATLVLMLREVQREGHKAVIHSAGASAVGKMLIRLFKEHGIITINLVRRDEAKYELFQLGADHVLNTKDSDFDSKLKEVIEKVKPTKAFDAIGGEFAAKLVKAMPPKSIITVYGGLGGQPEVTVSIWDLFGGKTLNGFIGTLPYAELSFKEKEELADYVQKRLKTTLKSDIVKTFSLEKSAEAVACSVESGSAGRVLIKPWN